MKPEKYDFFPSVPVTKYAYFFSEFIAVETCLFFKLSFCSTFMAFTILDSSFGEHESSLFMHDAEEFFFPSPLTYAYASGTYI